MKKDNRVKCFISIVNDYKGDNYYRNVYTCYGINKASNKFIQFIRQHPKQHFTMNPEGWINTKFGFTDYANTLNYPNNLTFDIF